MLNYTQLTWKHPLRGNKIDGVNWLGPMEKKIILTCSLLLLKMLRRSNKSCRPQQLRKRRIFNQTQYDFDWIRQQLILPRYSPKLFENSSIELVVGKQEEISWTQHTKDTIQSLQKQRIIHWGFAMSVYFSCSYLTQRRKIKPWLQWNSQRNRSDSRVAIQLSWST